MAATTSDGTTFPNSGMPPGVWVAAFAVDAAGNATDRKIKLEPGKAFGLDAGGNPDVPVIPTGADPWTTLTLASDFLTNSAVAVDVTGLSFSPVANATYEFRALLLCRTPVTLTVGPRPGLAWPTGMLDGVARLEMPTATTTSAILFGNIVAPLLAAVGGLPSLTQSFLATISGVLVAGTLPSGTLKIQLASETALTNVSLKAGSLLSYRRIV